MFPSLCQRPAGVWGAVQLRLSQVSVTGGAQLRQRPPQLPQRAFPAAAEGLCWGGAAAGPAVHHPQVGLVLQNPSLIFLKSTLSSTVYVYVYAYLTTFDTVALSGGLTYTEKDLKSQQNPKCTSTCTWPGVVSRRRVAFFRNTSGVVAERWPWVT